MINICNSIKNHKTEIPYSTKNYRESSKDLINDSISRGTGNKEINDTTSSVFS